MRYFTAIAFWVLLTASGETVAVGKTEMGKGPSGLLSPKPGFVQVEVMGVVQLENSQAVVLRDAQNGMVLPIWIGEAEAFSIQLRLERRRFERPLCHDLMDRILKELGGELIKVQIDDLRNNTFLATIFLRQGKRTFTVDARPSDAIALAIGNQIPIFVARQVMERAGTRDSKDEESPPEPPSKSPELDSEEHTI